MEKLELSEILKATGGRLEGNVSSCCYIENISTDTRTLKKGDLFIALKGSKFDGHNFVDTAFKKGAKGAIVQKDSVFDWPVKKNNFIISVDNTLFALGKIANYYLKKFNPKIIGITGSCGKTTTKEMVANLLSARFNVLKNKENYNNEIGLPLTIFDLNKEHDVLVLEMAARSTKDDIKYLCGIAQPDISIITNIGTSHIEFLKTKKNIFKTKAEIIHNLKENGIGVINYDDTYLRKLKTDKRIITYGIKTKANVFAESIAAKENGFTFALNIPEKNIKKEMFLPLLGYHNIYNLLSAISVANIIFDIDINTIAEKILKFKPQKARLEIINLKNIKILSDFYNANPSSVMSSIVTLCRQVNGKRKIAVLGDMRELGKISEREHRKIGRFITRYRPDILITVGEKSKYIFEEAKQSELSAFHFSNNESAGNKLLKIIKNGDVILIKGSRGQKMEEIFEMLKDGI